jgi:hypothetical protein
MNISSRILCFILRWVGTICLFALPCVFMPYAWMNAIHEGLGMGQLPDEPIVGYLARSTSFFYAVVGGFFWVVSLDLDRYRLLLTFAGGTAIVLGTLLLVIDHLECLPLWWRMSEGPFVLVLGVLILTLNRQGTQVG